MATGQNIKASEYNAIRTKIEQVLDTGGVVGGIKGYGQPLISRPVEPGNESDPNPQNNLITRNDWEALRRDIINIKIHQENPKDSNPDSPTFGEPIIPSVINIPTNEPIRFGSTQPNTNFSILIDQLSTTSLRIAEGRALTLTAPDTPVIRDTPWTYQLSCQIEITFTGYTRDDGFEVTPINHARFFFNSGGKFRLFSRRQFGTPSAQNNAWSSLLVQAGARELAALQPSNLHFYNLTDEYQTLYEISSTGPYRDNIYRIESRCDVPTNSQGTATKVFFRVFWLDEYQSSSPNADPPDRVDGELSLFLEEYKAFGPIFNSINTEFPTGNFEIPSPIYSVSPIFDA